MSTASSPQTARPSAAPGWWRLPLLAGVCFGLGYGVVQRLMVLEFSQLVQLGQAFDVREFPGTSLEALRLRTGAEVQSIRGDLGVLELEEQEQEQEQEQRRAGPGEASLEPSPLMPPLPDAEPSRFREPLDAAPDPEPVQPEPAQPQSVPPEPVPLPEPPGQAPDTFTP